MCQKQRPPPPPHASILPVLPSLLSIGKSGSGNALLPWSQVKLKASPSCPTHPRNLRMSSIQASFLLQKVQHFSSELATACKSLSLASQNSNHPLRSNQSRGKTAVADTAPASFFLWSEVSSDDSSTCCHQSALLFCPGFFSAHSPDQWSLADFSSYSDPLSPNP